MSAHVIALNENTFKVKLVDNRTGKESEETFNADKALEDAAIGRSIMAAVRSAPSARIAWLSFLGKVYASKRMDGYIGSGDKTEGKISKEFKAAVREAESDAIRGLVAAGAMKLPGSKDQTEEQKLQSFLSELREDKNYSNAKSHTSRYVAFVGKNIVTESGYIVPVPVQKTAIDEVLNVQPKEKSMSRHLTEAMKFLEEHAKLTAEDATESLSLVNLMRIKLQNLVDEYAELATHHASVRTNGVADESSKVIDVASRIIEEPAQV